jgi:hypothetical protein
MGNMDAAASSVERLVAMQPDVAAMPPSAGLHKLHPDDP